MAVLEAKKSNPDITLEMILPYKDQAAEWDDTQKATYNRILKQADAVAYVSDKYYNGVMAERNLRLVEGSSVCVAYMVNPRTGTGQTVRYARERDIEIINFAKND